MSRLRPCLLPLVCLLGAASLARAGGPPPTPAPANLDETARAAASKLVRDGVLLLDAGDLPGALAKFRAAYARFPSAKILVNIGTTLTRMGRSAEAANVYQTYLEATGAEANRIAEVKTVLASLDPDLGKLTVAVDPPDAEVRVNDGEWLPPATGHVIRVAPGPYLVRARRGTLAAEQRGKIRPGEAQALSLRLSESGAPRVDTTSPPPVPAPADAARAAAEAPGEADLDVDVAPRPASPGRGRRTAALIAGGAGIAALAAGAVVGMQARSTWQDAHAMCPDGCTGSTFDDADALADDARARAGVATVLVGVGGVAVAAGAVLWLTAPRAPRATQLDASVGPGQVGLAISGSF